MDGKEIKDLLSKEIEGLKESLSVFVKTADMQTEIEAIKAKIEENSVKGLEDKMSSLEKAAEEQGLALKKIRERGEDNKVKSFKSMLEDNRESLEAIQKGEVQGKKLVFELNKKSIQDGAVGSDTFAFRDGGVGQIQRGKPYIRDYLNVVPLGNNTRGDVKWYEQATITNSAELGAENFIPAAQSDITWVEKTLSAKRIKDYIKVSREQIQDIDFITGEVQNLVNRNMRLIENTQLYEGTGLTVNMTGLNTYATAFDATGIAIANADILDLIAKCRTQVVTSTLDGYMADTLFMNPVDLDDLRLLKDATTGVRQFPQWALGGNIAISGMNVVENSLATADTLLMGDLSVATLFEWNGMTIEMYQIDDDALTGMVTIVAYQRENLRVKDVDVDALVKVASIATEIAAITAP